MATRVRVGEWSVEVDGERLTWTRGDEALVQSRTELRALGPPAAITLRASYRTGLEQLMRVVFAGTEAEHEAVGSVFPRLAQLTSARAGEAIERLLARVSGAQGPVKEARELLEVGLGGGSMPVHDRTIDALEAAVTTPELAAAFAPFVTKAFDRGWPRRAAEAVSRALGVQPVLADVVAEGMAQRGLDAHVARALWMRARREGGDAADARALDDAAAAAHELTAHEVGFFLSCAARHVAAAASCALPAYRGPGDGQPDLGGREGGPIHVYTARWTCPTRAEEPQGVPPEPSPCRVCAAPTTETVYYRNDSGTGWRSEIHDMRCATCDAFVTHEVDD
ncbi:MAG: hypothetical protein H6726_12570 [Sandaracinaceae bacterium]|nr:hypothetical protein [Myxococcales bacterium]MCB9658474.1 hypothetical protein [Sandaracinaceae bacterium]